MTRARGISLAVSAAAAETVAALLIAHTLAPAGVAVALLLHAIGVLATVRLLDHVAIGLGLSPLTPLAVVTAVFLPVVGPIGLGFLLRAVARGARGAHAELPPTITELPPLPAAAPEAVGETLGVGAIVARLRFAPDSDARVRVVLATRRLDGARAVPLLREALRDRQEDVRLLAYAMLEDRERHADATVRALQAALAAAPASRQTALHDRLANAHWELCYQGLVAGELESFALGRALEHLDAASAAGGASAARWLLRARVLLRRGDAAAARLALDESRRAGMPARTVDPYFAEAAFIERGVDRAVGAIA
jgi:hypothetical protein